MNVPAVEVAEAAGYGAVAELAHKAGLADIRATPAMALGSYDVTPLEIAGAYTLFANKGVMVEPRMMSRIVDKSGDVGVVLATRNQEDPRSSREFPDGDLMEDVLRIGTGAGVRARGFTLPAAGKTGTSHDAWFAGYTTKLLCIVWVGLDDYQDLKLEGAKAALPIWTEFMKRAHKHRAYRDVAQFDVPDGVVSAQIDPLSGAARDQRLPESRHRILFAGHATGSVLPAAPSRCDGDRRLGNLDPEQPAALPNAPPTPGVIPPGAPPDVNAPAPEKNKQDGKKPGLFDKLKSIFH